MYRAYLLVLFSSCCLLTIVTGSSYYVAAPDGAPCPNTTSTCQELSFYTNQTSAYFTSNTVFYFLEGYHILDQQEAVNITGVSNLTLQGLGSIEPGPHETVMQSTVVIQCNGGFAFIETQFVTIEAITLNGCTGRVYDFGNRLVASGLAILLSHNFLLQYFSVQNGSGYGLLVINSFNLTIEASSFYRNQYLTVNCTLSDCRGGNALIIFSDTSLTEDSVSNNSKLQILNSNFSFSFGQLGTTTGLMIDIANTIDYRVDVVINNVVAYGNSGSYGANIHIAVTSAVAHYSIDINNTRSLYGNIIHPLDPHVFKTIGAGLYFYYNCSKFVEATLLINNSEFSYNQAISGGGMYVFLDTYSSVNMAM